MREDEVQRQPTQADQFSSAMQAPTGEIFETSDNPQVYVSNGVTFRTAIGAAWPDSSIAALWDATRNSFLQSLEDSPVLSTDQVQEFKKDRPGISFPDQVRESTANAIVNEFDSRAFREKVLAHSRPGLASALSALSGGLIGIAITDPLALALAGGAGRAMGAAQHVPKLMGIQRSAFKSAFLERSAGRAIKGAVEFGTFGATQGTAEEIRAITEGESWDNMKILMRMAEDAFIGAPLVPLGGAIADRFSKTRKFFDRQFDFISGRSSDDAVQSAFQMMANGKDPKIGVSVKHGVQKSVEQFHAERNLNNLSIEEAVTALEDVKIRNNDLIKENKDAISNLETQMKGPLKEGELEPLQERLKELKAEEIRLNDIDASVEAQRWMAENEDFKVSDSEIETYLRDQDTANSDFANGTGPEVLTDAPPVENREQLLNDIFSDNYKAELEKVATSSEQRLKLDQIKNQSKIREDLKDAIDKTIECIMGT